MRKRLFTFSAVFFSIINFSTAQITFQKTFGGTVDELGYSVKQTTDGGYIITGNTTSFGLGGGDVYLIKTDVNGDLLWTKTFGGASYDHGFSVQQTLDGGYIITGDAYSFGAGSYDVYLIKTDNSGILLWRKTFGGMQEEWGNTVQQTTDGGYIIAGTANSFGAGTYNAYLIKTDANGDSLWIKTFGGIGNYWWGNSVQQTSDGGYIISGITSSFGAGGDDVSLVKTDANGDLLWTKTFGGASSDAGYSLQQTMDGGYIITGVTNSFGAGDYDVYLIKTDTNGDNLWSKTFGGTNADWGHSVRQTSDGGYIIVGTTSILGVDSSNVYLIKTDVNGDSLWTKTFGGTDWDGGISIAQTTDGGYIIVGYTISFAAGGTEDVYLIKTDSLGNSGCNETSTATIVTSPPTQVTSPATMVSSMVTTITTPPTAVGSGGIVTTVCTTVGINEITSKNPFLISPNPSADNFIISFEKTMMEGKVEILNILGENIFSEKVFNESKKEINLKNISDGIYFVKVYDGEKYYSQKIIIEQD